MNYYTQLKYTRHLAYLIVCIITCQGLYAQNTWIVSNDPSFAAANFDTIQNAIDSAASGDIIYVHGTPFTYNGNLIINKKLNLVGPGYWKSQNNIMDENVNTAYVNGTITLAIGSDSSIVEGLKSGAILIEANDIIIRYNQIVAFGPVILVGLPMNIFIYGNHINECMEGSGINVNVFNNICQNTSDHANDFWRNSANCINCIFQSNSLQNLWASNALGGISNCIFRNNIVHCASFSISSSAAIENNLFTDTDVVINGVPTDSLGNGNIDSVDIITVWNLANPSLDGRYLLIGDSTTNVAFGAGFDGADCGAYGGITPYILSGIVKVPVIYQMHIPFVGDTLNNLNIKIKAKSN